VGCGDGRILNRLDGKYECIGLDISNEALKYVKTKKIHDSLENLPFADNKLWHRPLLLGSWTFTLSHLWKGS